METLVDTCLIVRAANALGTVQQVLGLDAAVGHFLVEHLSTHTY